MSFFGKVVSSQHPNLLKWNPRISFGIIEIIFWSVFQNTYYMESLLIINKSCSSITAQKMKFSIKDFFRKCDQIRKKLRIWSHFLKKSLMENFIFCAMYFGIFSKHGLHIYASHNKWKDILSSLHFLLPWFS